MDYYAWGMVKENINHIACNTKAELINKIKVFEALHMDTMKTVCGSFRSWIEAVVDTEGGFFESIDFCLL